jgi:hypothetical protein
MTNKKTWMAGTRRAEARYARGRGGPAMTREERGAGPVLGTADAVPEGRP